MSGAPPQPPARSLEMVLLGLLMLVPGFVAVFLIVVMFDSLIRDAGLTIFMVPLFLLGIAIAYWGVRFIRRGLHR